VIHRIAYAKLLEMRPSSASLNSRLTAPARSSARMVHARFQNEREPRQGNVDGHFFVDKTCIDCDTCRWMASETFARVGNGSSVIKQPANREARIDAIRAVLACPTCAPPYPHAIFVLHFQNYNPSALYMVVASCTSHELPTLPPSSMCPTLHARRLHDS
jgi:ferredoxin